MQTAHGVWCGDPLRGLRKSSCQGWLAKPSQPIGPSVSSEVGSARRKDISLDASCRTSDPGALALRGDEQGERRRRRRSARRTRRPLAGGQLTPPPRERAAASARRLAGLSLEGSTPCAAWQSGARPARAGGASLLRARAGPARAGVWEGGAEDLVCPSAAQRCHQVDVLLEIEILLI